MRCCKDLGIASELWDPKFVRAFKSELVAVWCEHSSTKKKKALWFKKGEIDVQFPWKKTGPVGTPKLVSMDSKEPTPP